MVMTLRKRVAPVERSPSSSPEKRREVVSRKKGPRKFPKSRKGKLLTDSDTESGPETDTTTGYEKVREQRIRENRERMEKLGIISLSSQMFESKTKKTKVLLKKKRYPPLFPRPPRSPARKSSRLKNISQTSCFENERSLKDMGISVPDSWTSEVYTEDHEKLLGDCETAWTLNVDGFGEDGERLYDPVNGTSCHQCRQKTLAKHTFCYKCRSGQGQICGDCLYTRYGENLLETVKKSAWLCPACREICNCSRCRRAKGWPPLTILYSKVIESGFKSVAHYIILTRRAGNLPQEQEYGTLVVDLTEGETLVPLDYECSDSSAEWSEFDSDGSDNDNDVSKPEKRKVDQAIEEQVDLTEESEVLQEMTVDGGLT